MFTINDLDIDTQIPDLCHFGIGFKIADVDQKLAKDKLDEQFNIKDSTTGTFLRFNYYPDSGYIYYYHKMNLMRLTRQILVREKLIKPSDLTPWFSTNGNDNFIPLAIRRRLGIKLRNIFYRQVVNAVIQELNDKKAQCKRRLDKFKYLKGIKLDNLAHFKLTSAEIALDIAVQPGFSFDQNNEYELRMADLILSGKRGVLIDGGNGHELLPDWAYSTYKYHGRDGVPSNNTEMKDGSWVCAYIKEMPLARHKDFKDHAWMMRLERRCAFGKEKWADTDQSQDGHEQFGDYTADEVVPDRRFRDSLGLSLLFEKLATHHSEQLVPVLTTPFPGNDTGLVTKICDLIEYYAPYRSRLLIRILTTGVGKLTVAVAKEVFNYKEIRELEIRSIIKRSREPSICKDGKKRNYGRFFVLNWWKFGIEEPSKEQLNLVNELLRFTQTAQLPDMSPDSSTKQNQLFGNNVIRERNDCVRADDIDENSIDDRQKSGATDS